MSGVVVAVGLLGCGGPETEQDPFVSVGHTDQEIVGGIEARPNSIPWIVSLQQSGSHFCGGSLVRVGNKEESDIVLTAAHCVYDGLFDATASAGAHDLYRPTSTQVTARVTKAVYHPQYNPDTTMNDIAVLKLDKPIKFDTSVTGACGLSSGMRPNNVASPLAGGNTRVPVCLPASGERVAVNAMATVAGWGLTREGGYDTSSILLQVGVPVLAHQSVANSYRTQGINIDESAMFGAGYPQGGKDSCQGDSGGPLVVQGPQGYVLQGIVSFGVGCARAGLPGIYTRVSNYIPWINTQIRNLSAVR